MTSPSTTSRARVRATLSLTFAILWSPSVLALSQGPGAHTRRSILEVQSTPRAKPVPRRRRARRLPVPTGDTQVAASATPGVTSVTPLTANGLTAEQRRILSHMSLVQLPDGAGGTVETIRFTGVNVQVVNGLGATNGYPSDPLTTDPLLTTTNGTGNLILGYNDLGSPFGDARTGSHNLVIGGRNSYSSFGGIVAGHLNTVSGAFASVLGGGTNIASGTHSSVSGGSLNTASGTYSTIGGGHGGISSGLGSSVSGGFFNNAQGDYSSVTGGANGYASGTRSAISGGVGGSASGISSSVNGGQFAQALGDFSSVSGGYFRSAAYANNWTGGGLTQNN